MDGPGVSETTKTAVAKIAREADVDRGFLICVAWSILSSLLLFAKYGLELLDLDPNDGGSLFLKMFLENVILQKINRTYKYLIILF